jgi:6-phosphofructokinase 2
MRELRELVESALAHEGEQDEAVLRLVKNAQAEIVVVSMGAAGALLASEHGCERIRSPSVPVTSKVGAGDSMVVAGIVLALARNMSIDHAVRFGIACGAAAVMMPGTQLCRREDAERLFAQITA